MGHSEITSSLRAADGPAICAYVTGGFPTPESFGDTLLSVSRAADVVEVGIPFTDPMADGLTIQDSSRVALAHGTTLQGIFDVLASNELEAPHVLMGYYNPFLSYGLDRLADEMVRCGTSGLIVPDLPLEESEPLTSRLRAKGLGLIQLIAPTSPDDRIRLLAQASDGFVYAVASTGVTGGSTEFNESVLEYLSRIKVASDLPVLAGFGVRSADQVAALAGHVDGVVVGSALIAAIDSGRDPEEFLNGLRQVGATR